MESNELPPLPAVNKHSIVSLVLGVLTVVSLCIAIFPIPGTGFVCYPSSLLLGLMALVLGLVSLNRIKKHNQTGHSMAWTGIVIGGMVFLCVACLIAGFVTVLLVSPDLIPTHPLFNFTP